jgi:hypothetical protein
MITWDFDLIPFCPTMTCCVFIYNTVYFDSTEEKAYCLQTFDLSYRGISPDVRRKR